MLPGFRLATPVIHVDVDIQDEPVIVKPDPDVLESLPMNTCLGVPEPAAVVTDAGAQPVEACLEDPLGVPGVHVSATDIGQWKFRRNGFAGKFCFPETGNDLAFDKGIQAHPVEARAETKLMIRAREEFAPEKYPGNRNVHLTCGKGAGLEYNILSLQVFLEYRAALVVDVPVLPPE